MPTRKRRARELGIPLDQLPDRRAIRPVRNGRHPVTLEQRFWSKVDKSSDPEGCWQWTGSRGRRGYGRINLGGKNRGAHRASWTLAFGGIPEGLCVLHRCDNPPCVRPDHLFLGTYKSNVDDMIEKGRRSTRVGRANGKAIMSDDDIHLIRQLKASGVTAAEISRRYGVTKTCIGMILRGQTWTHV